MLTMASQKSPCFSILSLAPLGGAMMALSMFFRLSYGPMGGEISYYSLISHNLAWDGWPMLLIAWPVLFGALETVFSLAQLHDRSAVANAKWHAIAAGTVLLLVAGLQLLLFARRVQFENLLRREVLVSLVPLIAVIIGVGLVLTLKWTLRKRLQWLRIIGTTWIVVGLFPVSPSVPLADFFRVYGMGYWMMLAGTLMVTVVALFDLAGTDAYPQNPIAAEQ